MSETPEQLDARMAENWAFNLAPEDVARIIRGVARTASRPYLGQPAWSVVTDVFSLGSTFASALCRRAGIDPNKKLREVRHV